MRLGTMRGAEVFEAGVRHGKNYTEADLDQIVRNCQLAEGIVEPPLALGHEDRQQLLEALRGDPEWTAAFHEPTFRHNTGSPAIGQIKNVRREGRKLKADITHIPGKIADLMHARMLNKFSVELYPQPPADAPPGCKGLMLKRVSVMGREQPELKTLADWHGLLFGEGDVAIEPWAIEHVTDAQARPDGVWEVFMECSCKGDDTVADRKTLEKQLRDAGYSDGVIANLAALPDDKLAGLVAEAVKKPPAPPPTPSPPNPPPPPAPANPPQQAALPANFSELVAAEVQKAAAAVLEPIKQQAQQIGARVGQIDQETTRRLAADRARTVEAFCERWERESFVLPREVDKGAKVPNLYHRLMAADGSAVRKFGEAQATEFDSIVQEIEGRGPGFARRFFSEKLAQGQEAQGEEAQAAKDAAEYAARRNKKAG